MESPATKLGVRPSVPVERVLARILEEEKQADVGSH